MSEALAKVADRVKTLAKQVQADITFDDDGAATLPETWVKDNLSEGLTLEAVKQVQDEEAAFVSALALGLGEATQPLMEKNKGIARTSLTTAFGANIIKTAVDREVTVRIPGSGEERQKYGDVSVKLESGAAARRGDLKRVREAVQANFTAKFGK